MNRDDLIATAALLKQPSAGAGEEFASKRELLAAGVNRSMADRPDLDRLTGPTGRQMSEDNNRNFSLFMESLFQDFQAETLVDTALWVFRAYRSHGFAPIYWQANLDTWREQLQRQLSQRSFVEIAPFYTWLITNIPVFTALTDSSVTGETTPPSSNLHPPR